MQLHCIPPKLSIIMLSDCWPQYRSPSLTAQWFIVFIVIAVTRRLRTNKGVRRLFRNVFGVSLAALHPFVSIMSSNRRKNCCAYCKIFILGLCSWAITFVYMYVSSTSEWNNALYELLKVYSVGQMHILWMRVLWALEIVEITDFYEFKFAYEF